MGALFILAIAVTNLIKRILSSNATFEVYDFVLFGVASGLACYLLVYRKDKYLEYFEEFDGWTKAEKMKYGWSSFGFILFVFALLIGSFMI